jgi:uncharacterized protein YndB with AHSA1/START domain
MTTQKTFKRRVRDRMAKTGESYTAARRMLISGGHRPTRVPQDFVPPVAEERVAEATGRGWPDWFALLDAWGAERRSHTEIAAWLRSEHAVDGWYSQALTLGYERARGLRAPGQNADGFVAGVSRTVAVPVDELFAAVHDDERREAWLPGADLHLRTATAPRSARYDWEDGETRVVVWFEAAGDAKSRLGISHERLPDADTSDAMKAFWRERLDALKAQLEA